MAVNQTKRGGRKGREVGANGKSLLSRAQAARFLGVNVERVRYMRHTGQLESVEVQGVHVYRREALELVRAQQRSKLAARAFVLFERGTKAADVVIKLEAEPDVIADLHRAWAEMTSAIVVQAPRGSRAAWEKTYKIGPLTPRKMRRALEIVSASPELRSLLAS